MKKRLKEPVGEPIDERSLVGGLTLEADGSEGWHQRERKDHGPQEGKDDGQSHRPKELSLDSLESENRKINNHDDEFAEHRRLSHFNRGVADDVQLLPVGPVVGQVPHTVFDHDHRAINH